MTDFPGRNETSHARACRMGLDMILQAVAAGNPEAASICLELALVDLRKARTMADNNAEQCVVDGLFDALGRTAQQVGIRFAPAHIPTYMCEH